MRVRLSPTDAAATQPSYNSSSRWEQNRHCSRSQLFRKELTKNFETQHQPAPASPVHILEGGEGGEGGDEHEE